MSTKPSAIDCPLDHTALGIEYAEKIGDGNGICPDCDTRLPIRPEGCQCQAFGKSGVPYPSGKCIVCGDPVNWYGRVAL